MTDLNQPSIDIAKAKEIWAEYERTHDLSGMEKMAVGIDPDSGEVHFGKSMMDIGTRLEREGRFKPLFYRWVNDPSYTHMRSPRWSEKLTTAERPSSGS